MPGTTLATTADMRAIAGQLATAGMDARVEAAGGYLYVVATAQISGHDAEVEATVDDDGHIELRWQHQAADSWPQAAAVIARAVAAITSGPGSS